MFDFFYSESLNLYISRKPLILNSRVKKKIHNKKVNFKIDNQGRINNINFENSKKLLSYLGSKMLTPAEYFIVLQEAFSKNDKDMILQLTSKEYTEWLDRVYFKDGMYIDNPKILKKHKYTGKKQKSSLPNIYFGWFDIDNINKFSGEPTSVKLNKSNSSFSWIYYRSKEITNSSKAISPVRGYVLAEDKPFLDLRKSPDFLDSTHLIRECRNSILEPTTDYNLILEINDLIKKKQKTKLISFIEKNGSEFSKSYDQTIYNLREKVFDNLGELSLAKNVDNAISKISKVYNTKVTYKDLEIFLKNRKTKLKSAIENKKDIVFVIGHKNPDTDAVVSSIFEAYRNHLLNGKNICYVPIIQGNAIPKEISVLLKDLSKYLLLTNNPLYKQAKKTNIARWIAVDHNKDKELQNYIIAVVDHHTTSKYIKNKDIPKTIELIGSTSALVANKFLGMGVNFSKEVAKILYSATLMDTDNRVKHKTTTKDTKIMNFLKKQADVMDDNEIYSNLMQYLLITRDANLLFYRDYKEDFGFGYSEIKLKDVFDKQGDIRQTSTIKNLLTLAKQNTLSKNMPFTLLKLSDHLDDNRTVNKERIYLIFNNNTTESFKKAMFSTIESIIKSEHPTDACVIKENYVDFWGSGFQLSRKKIAPILKLVMKIEMQGI